jgi:hypothetical protein
MVYFAKTADRLLLLAGNPVDPPHRSRQTETHMHPLPLSIIASCLSIIAFWSAGPRMASAKLGWWVYGIQATFVFLVLTGFIVRREMPFWVWMLSTDARGSIPFFEFICT